MAAHLTKFRGGSDIMNLIDLGRQVPRTAGPPSDITLLSVENVIQ